MRLCFWGGEGGTSTLQRAQGWELSRAKPPLVLNLTPVPEHRCECLVLVVHSPEGG